MIRYSEMSSSTLLVRSICLIIFLAFCFLYIYHYEGDIYAVAQHILSEGKTSYNHLIGAIVLTAVLYSLHCLTRIFVCLHPGQYALTYMPSFMLLALLTYINGQIVQQKSMFMLVVIVPLILVCTYTAFYIAKSPKLKDFATFTLSVFSHEMWTNLLIMIALMLATIFIGNNDKALHSKVKYEIRSIRYHAEVERYQTLRAEQDSLREVAIRDSIKAVKDSIRNQDFRLPI